MKTLCGAEANLRRVESLNLIDISFTSMGSEDFPPTDTVVATLGKFIAYKKGDMELGKFIAYKKGDMELVNSYRPIQVKRDNGGHNTVPHWLGAQATNTGVQVAEQLWGHLRIGYNASDRRSKIWHSATTSSGGMWVPDVRRYLAQVSRREGTASNLTTQPPSVMADSE